MELIELHDWEIDNDMDDMTRMLKSISAYFLPHPKNL